MGFKEAQALATNRTLIQLEASNNYFGALGAAALANMPLKKLGVYGNGIGDLGAEALARSLTLSELDARHNGIGDLGAEALARSLTLSELDACGNEIGQQGTRAFLTNSILIKLEMDYPYIIHQKLGLDCVQKMKRALNTMLARNRRYAAVMPGTVDLAMRVVAARVVEGTGLEGISRSIVPLAGLIRDFAGLERTANAQAVENLVEKKAPLFASLVADVRDEKEDEEEVDAAATPF